jgi:ABC-type amino acid transport substrate-binding protein
MRPFPKLLSILAVAVGTAAFVGPALWSQTKPLRLVTQHYPPYQVHEAGGAISGSSIDTMRCALKGIGQDYTLDIVPGTRWEEVQADTKAGKYDGFFGALFTRTQVRVCRVDDGPRHLPRILRPVA